MECTPKVYIPMEALGLEKRGASKGRVKVAWLVIGMCQVALFSKVGNTDFTLNSTKSIILAEVARGVTVMYRSQ